MSVNLENYKVILWDFDGVIVDSNKVREDGFREVLKDYPDNQIEELIKYHKQNGGLSRYVKFRYFFEKICNSCISEIELQCLADLFSKIMLKNLSSKSILISDTLLFLESNSDNFEMHIMSGSDQNELRILCSKLGIEKNFKSVNGSPTHKNKLVDDFLSNSSWCKDDVCLIGDSINDFEAANFNGIDFFGYNNIDLKKVSAYITSFG